MSEQPSYYAIIPAFIRYDKNLSPNEKLLYGEITALTNKSGYCFASNSYFSDLYAVHKNTVSKWISNLEKQGYIQTQIIKNQSKQIEQRRIFLSTPINEKVKTPINEKVKTPINEKVKTPINEKVKTPINEKVKTPINEKVKDNNTSFNTTSFNSIIADAPVSLTQNAPVQEIINHLNQAAGTNYQAKAESNIRLIKARLKEATVEEIKAVIDRKCAEWLDHPKMSGYLRPSTLFNATKFHDYLGQLNRPTNLSYNYDQPNQKKGLTDIINGWED